MKIVAGVATDIGRVREGNEDSYLVEPPLFAVADGMGGHRGGEVASQLALETIEERFRTGEGSLSEQVRLANRAVFDRSANDRKVAGMGTTLTAAIVTGEQAHLVHVGDTRAYLLRAGAMRQLTQDHTLVARMVRTGEISAEEAEVHPHRNVLTRVVGTEPDVVVDEETIGLLEGDRLLLCSDGLTGMVTEDQIRAILEAATNAQEAADRLVRAANRAGGVDNITALVLEAVVGDEDPAEHPADAVRTMPAPVAPPATRTDAIALDRRRLIRWGVVAAAAAVVLLVGFFAFRAWLDTRWYVGVSDGGNVAIYQGIPASVLGFELSHIEVETPIAAAQALATGFHDGLNEGINVGSRSEANQLVAQIRKDVGQATRGSKGGSP